MAIAEPRLGLLGGWVYLPSEWDEKAARHKIIPVGRYHIFRNGWVGGCIFVGRVNLLRRYSSKDPSTWGTPLQQMEITKAGFISGYPLPICFSENLDDPRSPHCRMNRPGGWDQFAAYSARMRNFSGPEEYGRWIAEDARATLETSIRDQIRIYSPSLVKIVKRKLVRGLAKMRGRPTSTT
jgi:hypothetical protein